MLAWPNGSVRRRTAGCMTPYLHNATMPECPMTLLRSKISSTLNNVRTISHNAGQLNNSWMQRSVKRDGIFVSLCCMRAAAGRMYFITWGPYL
jgi:hypothetical protein